MGGTPQGRSVLRMARGAVRRPLRPDRPAIDSPVGRRSPTPVRCRTIHTAGICVIREIWYVMKSPTDPTSCKVLVSRRGDRARRNVDTAQGVTLAVKFDAPAGASRSAKRTRNGLVTRNTGAAKQPDVPKPELAGKRFPSAPARLSGVKGGGACRRAGWEHERAVGAAAAKSRGELGPGNNNRQECPARQSERPIVAMKRVTTAERRGLGASGADSKERVV